MTRRIIATSTFVFGNVEVAVTKPRNTTQLHGDSNPQAESNHRGHIYSHLGPRLSNSSMTVLTGWTTVVMLVWWCSVRLELCIPCHPTYQECAWFAQHFCWEYGVVIDQKVHKMGYRVPVCGSQKYHPIHRASTAPQILQDYRGWRIQNLAKQPRSGHVESGMLRRLAQSNLVIEAHY